MKYLVLFSGIMVFFAVGCATTQKPLQAADLGSPHGIVNHCDDDRRIIIDKSTKVDVPACTSIQITLEDGIHVLDFYKLRTDGPKFYASWPFEAKSSDWLLVEMYPG